MIIDSNLFKMDSDDGAYDLFSEDSNSSSSESKVSQKSNKSIPASPTSEDLELPEDVPVYIFPDVNKYQIISSANLNLFVKKIDQSASLDEQAADLVADCATTFVKDVSTRLVRLAKYRDTVPSLLELKFTLKREYNMEFPHGMVTKK